MKHFEIVAVWSVFLATSVFGHVALKRAAGVSERFEYMRMLTLWKDPWALAAIASWTISCLVWALVLTRYNVTEAAGHSSLRYVAMVVFAALWFGEPMSVRQVAGAVLICAGIWLTAKP